MSTFASWFAQERFIVGFSFGLFVAAGYAALVAELWGLSFEAPTWRVAWGLLGGSLLCSVSSFVFWKGRQRRGA